MRDCLRDRDVAIFSEVKGIAFVLKNLSEQGAHVLAVIDNENRFIVLHVFTAPLSHQE